MDIWEILEDLNSLTDVSDPDCFHPNLYHAVQTVEMIRKDGHPEWMQLIGLLHNVRKIMYKKNVMMKVLWKNNGQS
jgi:inositol oxygenase